ncbi:DEAD/DEAH box helicase family protein [Nostoc sp. LEGE 06077]|uniref:protein DpdE n=1 Tax=Nostoc sp. LEGE 06077 TaxID=915325 RepID=UPI00188195C6|nr:protein DpdE [Nostoc sp. LEGE 06077]MBE9209618.1 DEAD/DEAH box helicase family protein [Nostoc sp. LEGE 06077]
MIQIGSLVQSSNNSLGIGKVIEISQGNIVVEYFCSIGQRLQKTVPLGSLSPVLLKQQTRCYFQLKNQNQWIIGKIFGWDEDALKYQVDLPDKKFIITAEKEIYVRCNLAVKDAIETLAIKGHETPYLHDRRLALVKCLVKQRAVSHGMTGLISSNIHLYPHQVQVIRRVLEDSVQRYILADEVGLGKTIEAGVILRQYLLDEPDNIVLVLVPGKLVQQWKDELENKFYISHFPKRVVVMASEDVHKIKPQTKIGLLIVDEAQHIAAMANSQDRKISQQFEIYKNLAHKSEHLLLLSASHILKNDQDLLVMLHLLEPTIYQLNNLPDFQVKIHNSQIISQIISSLKNDQESSGIANNLEQLQKLFSDDKYLLSLVGKWEKSLPETLTSQDKVLDEICIYISETYRLHRRILCNRRAGVENAILNRHITPKEEYDLDERSFDIHELIEKWRNAAPNDEHYQRIFLLLFLASGTWLGILEQVIAARQSGIRHPALIKEFGNHDLNLLTQTQKFEGEEEILTSLRQIISQPSEDGDRIELLKIILLYRLSEIYGLQSFRNNITQLGERIKQRINRPIPGDSLPKILIFSGFGQSCQEIARSLSITFGAESIAIHQSEQDWGETEKNLTQFHSNPNCFILICDVSAQEGHNFQFIDWVINFDIPWIPYQLEQRICRFNRISNSKNIDFTVLVGADLEESLHAAWYQVLRDGFLIFTDSIASLDVSQQLSELEKTLFQLGATGLLNQIGLTQQEITQAQLEINSEDVWNEINIQQDDHTYFQELDNYDSNHPEIKRAIEGWIDDALKFKSIYHPDLKDVKYYQATKYTLVPVNELKTRFANSNISQFGTYNRHLANQNPGIKLFRIGEKLVETIYNYINWDDRGQAFALWRQDLSWDSKPGMEWFGFQCNFLVEFNLEKIQQIFTDYQLDDSQFNLFKRRVDSLFPPFMETIFIDARAEKLSEVQDEPTLNILQRPYQKDKNSHRVQDYNLAKERLEIIDNFIPPNNWQNVCYQVCNMSQTLLTERQNYLELCEHYAQIADQKLGHRVEQLNLRLNTKTWDHTLAEELKIERVLKSVIVKGIRQPQLQLESVGFIVISGRSLSEDL